MWTFLLKRRKPLAGFSDFIKPENVLIPAGRLPGVSNPPSAQPSQAFNAGQALAAIQEHYEIIPVPQAVEQDAKALTTWQTSLHEMMDTIIGLAKKDREQSNG